MKDFSQYGNRPDDQWEMLPWIPDPRPPFKIWVKPEQIAPFFLIPHHPYAISLLLKISDGFRTEEFCRLGLTGSSGDWERLVRGVIREFEENNSGVGLFHFDSDEDVFCVYSQYIDDLMMLAKMIRVVWAGQAADGASLISLKQRMSDISAEQALLLDKVLENMDDPDLNAQLKALMDEKQAVQDQIQTMEQEAAQSENRMSRMAELREWMAQLEVNLEYNDEQVRMAVEQITAVDVETIHIKFRYPGLEMDKKLT